MTAAATDAVLYNNGNVHGLIKPTPRKSWEKASRVHQSQKHSDFVLQRFRAATIVLTHSGNPKVQAGANKGCWGPKQEVRRVQGGWKMDERSGRHKSDR